MGFNILLMDISPVFMTWNLPDHRFRVFSGFTVTEAKYLKMYINTSKHKLQGKTTMLLGRDSPSLWDST